MTFHSSSRIRENAGLASPPRSYERGYNWLILALALVAPGCLTSQPWVSNHEPATPAICQVHAFWDSRIQDTQDVVNNGRNLRGLAGRVYVFSSESGIPEKGDGSIGVDLYDVSNPQPGVQPKRLERWE